MKVGESYLKIIKLARAGGSKMALKQDACSEKVRESRARGSENR